MISTYKRLNRSHLSGYSPRAAKSIYFYLKKYKVSSEEIIYALKLETAPEGIK